MQLTLSDTERGILDNFKQCFFHLQNEPIILYGLGEYTKLLLDNLPEFTFVALMDKNTVGQTIWGLPVISPSEVPVYKARTIVIVANYSSRSVIYSRIKHLERDGVTIYHFNGERLHQEITVTQKIGSMSELKKAILQHDIVSFDIFDTLLMRTVPSPSDVFLLVKDEGFVEHRIQAEKTAQKKYGEYYSLDTVYECIEDEYKPLKQKEIQTEIECAYAKKDVVALVDYAQKNGKQVFVTSDMYLPKGVIEQILRKIGVKQPFTLFLSNECKMSKYNGSVYEHFAKAFGNKKILHIGDDIYSDCEQAKKHGIDAFLIKPAYTDLNGYAKTIPSKKMLGMFLTQIDTPFSDRFECDTVQKVAYFVAPLLINYMNWLYQKTKADNIDTILFIARDGYLLEQMYRQYPEPKPKGVYFLTSRRALAVCSIKSEQDIIDVFNVYYKKKQISIAQFVQNAFGIQVRGDFEYKFLTEISKEELLNLGVLENKGVIIDNAKKERDAYSKYIDTVIQSTDTVAMINLVASGTTQFFAEKLLGKNIKFYCFQSTEDIKKRDICFDNLYSLYGDYISPIVSKSNLCKHYHFLESVLTSPDEQFIRFGENMSPVFFNENKRECFDSMSMLHNAILDVLCDYKDKIKTWAEIDFDAELMDAIFGLLFTENCVTVPSCIKDIFFITDPFSQEKQLFVW